VRCQGLLKIFRAPIHRAHRAVIFAIAQLSCYWLVSYILSSYCQGPPSTICRRRYTNSYWLIDWYALTLNTPCPIKEGTLIFRHNFRHLLGFFKTIFEALCSANTFCMIQVISRSPPAAWGLYLTWRRPISITWRQSSCVARNAHRHRISYHLGLERNLGFLEKVFRF